MSFRTTIAGIVAILAGLGMLGNILKNFMEGQPVTFEAIALAVTSIGAGFGLVAARDNQVSSEEVKANEKSIY